MLTERIRDCKDEAARPKGSVSGNSCQRGVELAKRCGRHRAVAACDGLKGRIEVEARTGLMAELAKPDDFGTH
jgi:hypothetical protein